MSATKSLTLCLMLLMPVSAITIALTKAQYADTLGITVLSDRSAYYYGQPISLSGVFTQYGQPVSNGTVAVEVYDPSGTLVTFRTLKTGTAPQPRYLIDFVELTPCDQTGTAQSSFILQQTLYVRVTIQSQDAVAHNEITMITVLDGNGRVFGTRLVSSSTLGPGGSGSFFIPGPAIPSWAQPGNATLVASVFSDFPENGGTPYCEEKAVNFEIRRNPEIDYSTPATVNPQTPNGTFRSSLKLSPDSKPGNYQVYVSARSTLVNGTVQSLLTVQNTTSFSVMNTPVPPQASFTYYPVDSYVNMAVTFDASSSTAMGYNVALVNYVWDFSDGTSKVSTTRSVTTHVFKELDNYLVTLNVTDSNGLWCTTSRVITILNSTGPKADFSWDHVDCYINMNITFDGSNSTTQSPSVWIANYEWNFGDGSPNINTPNSVMSHTFSSVNDYLVILKVTDSQGLWYATSKIISILPPTPLKADFIWYPATPTPNKTVTFDATLTKPGWNGTAQPPIVNYVWQFGDTNVTSGYYPTIFHTYTALGNYAVTLNVTDASGYSDSVTYNVVVRTTALLGDINGDGAVDIYDAVLLARAFSSKPGDSNWNPNADINGDGAVDIYDAVILARHYGSA